MAYLKPSLVQVPAAVNDIITIQIKDPELMGADFTYRITDAADHIYRKGQFRGLRIQLRTAHLKEGIYYFNLQSCELDTCRFTFEKMNSYTVIE